MEQKLIFNGDESKYKDVEVTPQMRQAITVIAISKALGMGNAAETAKESLNVIRRRAKDTGQPELQKAKFFLIVEHVARNFPDLPISPDTVLLLTTLMTDDSQAELFAASLTWETLKRGRMLRGDEVMVKLLPKGPPSPAYIQELMDYYKEHPAELWPITFEVVEKH
jgi:hypothetical protein